MLACDSMADGQWEESLRQLAPHVLITGWRTPPLPAEWLEDAACPLRYVCHLTGSVRRLVPRGFIERGGLVSNWGERVSAQVAEHALLLALAALRNQAGWRPFLLRAPEKRGIEELATRTLFGRRVAIHGFGSVARALVPLIKPFGVTLYGYSTGVPEALLEAAGVLPCRSVEELFASSDVIFECESLTPSSAGLVSARVIDAMTEDAVFVNVGRGGLVDQTALVAAARRGRIRLALDVVADEPLTAGSELLELSDAVLSPHIGGPTVDRYPECGAYALANLAQFLRGDRPEAALSLAAYDRST
ncbi:MAG TPA: NAD(P)-dependent oxidoreductase [Opitutaceae bacterium]|nr:NAD(P)-dependent oxidoreductase [Opitutaceae bacterium]